MNTQGFEILNTPGFKILNAKGFPSVGLPPKLLRNCLKVRCFTVYRSRDSAVGKITSYGLDGSGIESWAIPVPARSKAWACGRSLAGTVGSNP